jgi:DNA repair protein RecO (recombination protein O)
VVLRAVDFGEADRILTLLTERWGRIAVMARGARRSQRRFAGALEPFAILEATIALGTGDVARLSEARLLRAFPRLLGSLVAMREAGRALELVRRVAPQREGEPRLLAVVERLFEELDGATPEVREAGGAQARAAVRALVVVGLAPRLDVCVGCGRAPEPHQAALFDPVRGGIVCRACGGGPLRLSARARRWMSAASTDADPGPLEDRAEVEGAIEAFVVRHAPS